MVSLLLVPPALARSPPYPSWILHYAPHVPHLTNPSLTHRSRPLSIHVLTLLALTLTNMLLRPRLHDWPHETHRIAAMYFANDSRPHKHRRLYICKAKAKPVAAAMSWTSILRQEWGEADIEMRREWFAPLCQVLARLRKTQNTGRAQSEAPQVRTERLSSVRPYDEAGTPRKAGTI